MDIRSYRFFGVFVLVLLALGSLSAAPVLGAEKEPLTIIVTAQSCPSAKPDLGEISVGVSVKEKTPSKVLQSLMSAMDAAVKVLKEKGVDEKDIQTHSLSLSQAYKEDDRNRQVPDGYQASQLLRVRVRDIKKVPETLQSAVDSGANLFYGLTWDLSDETKEDLSAKALPDAIKKAEEKAKTLAGYLGKSLGELRQFSHSTSAPSRPSLYKGRMAAAYDSVPAGEEEVRVTVTMTYELK